MAGDDDNDAARWAAGPEGPPALPLEDLLSLLSAASPLGSEASLGEYFVGLRSALHADQLPTNLADELERRMGVVAHRGDHVLDQMRAPFVLELLGQDVAGIDELLERMRTVLDEGRPRDADLVRRAEAARAWKQLEADGLLTEEEVAVLVHLLLPIRPVLIGHLEPGGAFDVLLRGLAPRRSELLRAAPEAYALLQPELDAVLDQEPS